MYSKLHLMILLLCWSLLRPIISNAECPVTLPTDSPVETGLADTATNDWYGGADLAALIPKNGHWVGMGPDNNYRNKFWWWRAGFDAKAEPSPNLEVTAQSIDASAATVTAERATSGWNETWNAMLVGMEFPSPGCWKVIGTYAGDTVLTLVVLVGDEND